jgi:lipopolysaccharide export system permease protein
MRTGKLITRLDHYVFRQLALALIAVTGGLTALVWLVQSLRFVELVVNHGLSFGIFLQLTALLIPSFVAVILPITTFVVVQFIYQRLAGDREITVMRTAGLSPLALSRPALALTAMVIAGGYALNLWIVPASLTSFRQFQWEIRNQMAAFLLQEGVFTPISNDLTVYVRSRDPDGTLRGILVDDGRDKSAHATILAERGRLIEGTNGPRVLLVTGSRQEIDHQTGRLNVLTFGQNEIDLTDNNRTGGERTRDMSELPLRDLLDPHPPNVRDASKWFAEGHKRLATPLTALSFAFVALLSVLTGTFRRHGSFVRPLVAIGTVVVLLATGLAVDNLAARDNALIPLIWLQAVTPGIVCGWLLLGPQLLPIRRRLPRAGPRSGGGPPRGIEAI